MPRPSNKEERRSQIARALMRVMADRGYDGASIADVAKEAELTQGLIHYHFKNKLEILLAVLEDMARRHKKGLEKKIAGCVGNPERQLAAFIDFHLGLGPDSNPELLACWIVLTGEAMRKEEVRRAYDEYAVLNHNLLSLILTEGVRQQVFKCEDLDAASAALLAAMQGYVSMAATTPELIPSGTAAGCVKKMAEGLLSP